jgi:hypothetical protein
MNLPDLDLEAMRNVDIRTVDPATLVDILDVKVDSSLPQPERTIDFIRQIKNPYCFRCGKIIVKVSHADTDVTLKQRLERL